jgi:hypothetical protein
MSCPTSLSNQVGEIRNVQSEVECQLDCRLEKDCSYFTWVRYYKSGRTVDSSRIALLYLDQVGPAGL